MLGTSILAIALSGVAAAQNPTASVTVDANANRRAIDSRVYGVAYGTTTQLSDLNVPLNRYGGNNSSRYNWQLNADNRDQDWYFESIGDASSVAGERGDTFMSSTQAAGARAMITIPMLDWVAKLGPSRTKLASFSQAKYGAQTGNDAQWFSDAGNGILKSTAQYVTGNDPNDANVPSSSSYQQQWVQAMVNKWGLATGAAPRYYILDNEHSIWHSTHRDVHPAGATMDEILTRIKNYATQVRGTDPNALIVVTFDEGTSNRGLGHGHQFAGGGNVAWFALGPQVHPGVYGTSYDHYSFLRTLEDGFDIAAYLNGAGDASPITGIWN